MNEASVQHVLSLFDRAVWILTAASGDRAGGLVATFVNNASLVPALPRIAAGIARHHHTWELMEHSRAFAAHLVDEAHADLLWRFGLGSGRDVHKLEGIAWRREQTGSPVLDDALAWLDCSIEAELDTGDRTIFLAAVVAGSVNRAGAPLTATRMFELGSPEQRRRMDDERRRDEAVDSAAIIEWRAKARLP